MKQIEFLFQAGPEPVDPAPGRASPRFWISRLLLLREPRVADDAVIRDIRLRRGLNILWAPPSPAGGETRLFDGRLTGHTAGKTTFCRLVRYLLGEPRFGASRTQDRIRERLPDGWVLGEVFIEDERWVVGRPFARGLHPFATKGRGVAEALEARGPYQEFLAALSSSVLSPIPVQALPHARRPLDWELLLTWLTRDQEARYASLVHWRDPSSESQSPSPTVGDRHIVLRALLGLMSDEERSMHEAHEAVAEQRRQLEVERPALRGRADEERRRLAKRLGLSDDGEAGPLFAARLREEVVSRKSALERAQASLAEQESAAAPALRALSTAAERSGALQRRLDEATDRLDRQRRPAACAEPAVVAVGDAGALARSDAGALAARRAAAPGLCGVPLALAAERGCPFAAVGEGADERIGGRELVATLERDVEEARQALDEARAAQQAMHDGFARQSAELYDARGRVAHDRAALDELGRLQSHARAAEKAVQATEEAAWRLATESRGLSERKASRQRGHAESLARLSDRFGHVAQALLGSQVGGAADVSGGELRLRVTEHGEREGAAMETVKVLAFDLATLTLGVEGHGYHPGFLVHDGPREADMDPLIYERLFLYAQQLEEKECPGSSGPGFQYIVTTTAPPPARLQAAPWLLDPLLDASVPEGRLLGIDL